MISSALMYRAISCRVLPWATSSKKNVNNARKILRSNSHQHDRQDLCRTLGRCQHLFIYGSDTTHNMRLRDLRTARRDVNLNSSCFPGHLNLDIISTIQRRSVMQFEATGPHTISHVVVPRTMLSSKSNTFLPLNSDSIGESFRRTLF